MNKNFDMPISHLINVTRLTQKGMIVKLNADQNQLENLAEYYQLHSVHSFIADLLITKWRHEGVCVTGKVKSDLTQTCSLTLEPLPASTESDIRAVYVPENSKLTRLKMDQAGEIIVEADDSDIPDIFTGVELDVGAIAAEFFALSLDPYPRKAGVDIHLEPESEEIEPAKNSLSAQLKAAFETDTKK
jgi:hypothetical protein